MFLNFSGLRDLVSYKPVSYIKKSVPEISWRFNYVTHIRFTYEQTVESGKKNMHL